MELLTLVVAAPVVLALLLVGFRNPMGTLLPAYAALVPFGSGLTFGLPSSYGSLSSLVGLALGLALIARIVTGQPGNRGIPATVPVWLLFLAVAGTTVYWSVAPGITMSSFANIASLILLYVLLVISQVDRTALQRTEMAVVLGGVVAALYGLAQLLLLGGLPTSEDAGPRFGRDLLGANNTAAALLLPLAVALAGTASRRRPEHRLGYGLAAAAIFAAIVLTGSRGGLLASIVTFVAVMLATPRGRSTLLGFGTVAVVALVVVLAVNPAGIGERQTARDSSSGRTEIWRVGTAACETHCLTGSGWGTFGRVYASLRASVPEVRVLERGTTYEPHNIWLLAAVEAGAAGVLIMTFGLGLTLVQALRLPAALRAPPLAGLVGTLFAGVFLSNFEFKFFWVTLAYVALARNVADAEEAARHLEPAEPAEPAARSPLAEPVVVAAPAGTRAG